jgi:hypothetical protein
MPTRQLTPPAILADAGPQAPAAAFITCSPLGRLEEISRLVGSVVAEWGDTDTVHLRQQHRTGFTDALVMTPFNSHAATPDGEPKLVTGRNLSLHGVSFAHDQPLPYRDVVLTFSLPGGEVESMMVRLTWCRFTRDGRYQSGGRLLRSVESPIGGDVDWQLLRRA